uniref:Uncharacterized protein n=1 Tax=Romanomermis culicivorax TaxID=13658 RepID=A0A915HF80_ROMCU
MALQHSLSKPMQAAWQLELYCTRKLPATNGQLHILVEKYVPEKENAFADFLGQKYDVDQPDHDKRTNLNQAKTTNIVNVVKTRVKSRQKLAALPQNDLEVPKPPDEEKIVDPSELPNQDQWPFTQQQIADTQKVDPTLEQTRQKIENQ